MKLFIKNAGAALFVLAALSLGMSSCQTIEGAGEDVETAGEAIEQAARR